MTRMLPPTIHATERNRAERRIYRVIREAPYTDNWVCLHSLGLAHHERKRRAEIDFVLLTHHGVFVLEVKGGHIARRNGVWYSKGRSGEHELRESPFDQASSAMFELEKPVREHFRGKPLAKTLFGYGVVMPDVTFEEPSPEYDQCCVFDRRDLSRRFTSYI